MLIRLLLSTHGGYIICQTNSIAHIWDKRISGSTEVLNTMKIQRWSIPRKQKGHKENRFLENPVTAQEQQQQVKQE